MTERFMVVAKLSNKGWQLAEMRGTEFAGSNPAYPMWRNSTQYLCGELAVKGCKKSLPSLVGCKHMNDGNLRKMPSHAVFP